MTGKRTTTELKNRDCALLIAMREHGLQNDKPLAVRNMIPLANDMWERRKIKKFITYKFVATNQVYDSLQRLLG